MTIQLGWDLCVLAGLIAVCIFWLGAIAEYCWQAWRHRRR